MTKDYDLAIVGAGVAGLCSAVSAIRNGFSVALIDAVDPDTGPENVLGNAVTVHDFSPKVSAITPSNACWMMEQDLWSSVEKYALPYTDVHVWEQLGSGKIHFSAHEYQRPALGYIVENQVLIKACITALEKSELVQTYFSERVETLDLDSNAHRYRIALANGQQIQAKLLVGADGANSHVRRKLALPTREWDYDQSAIICNVETEFEHQSTAWQRFSEEGPLAFLPLKDYSVHEHGSNHFCSIVWSLDTAKAKEMFALDDEAFCAALASDFESRLGMVKAVSKRYLVPLRQRHAKRYVSERALLVGDAAHTIHPLAGQGLNLGLADVQALDKILKSARDMDYDPGHAVLLSRYQRARQADNLAMMLGMEGFKRLFGARDPMLRLLRNVGVDLVDRHTLIKKQFASAAMGL